MSRHFLQALKLVKKLYHNNQGQMSVILAVFGVPLMVFTGMIINNGTNTTRHLERPVFIKNQGILESNFIYKASLTKVYDADTWQANIDLGFSTWRHNERLRLYAVDAPEIKKNKEKSLTKSDVMQGYKCRNVMLSLLGLNPQDYPQQAKYHDLIQPVSVIIQTIKSKTGEKKGKFGRYLAIIYKDGENLNEKLVSKGCASIKLYDGHSYPQNTPITPTMAEDF